MHEIIDYFRNLFNPGGFPARWTCGKWTDFHGWLYIISNIAIWAAYFAIPLSLFYFISKRKDVPFQKIFWLFMLFILLCGLTHLTDALIFWLPVYRFNGLLLFFTAIVSWFTFFSFYRILPETFNLKTPVQLEDLIKLKTAELEVTIRKLARKNSQLEDFAYIVSHNIRSPLSNMNALMSLYSIESSAAEKELIIAKMNEVLESFVHTVEDLTKVVKINQDIDLKWGNLKFSESLKGVTKSLSAQISSSETTIEYDFSLCEGITYPKIYLESIMLNLLTNSIKYRSEERPLKIKFRSFVENRRTFISCEDNGIGIDLKKYSDKIFGLYKTFHNIPDSRGVGLFITKKQIESLGGAISVESELSSWTRFTIRLN